LFLFAQLTSDHMSVIYLEEPFASATSFSRIPCSNRHGKRLFACLFLELIKW